MQSSSISQNSIQPMDLFTPLSDDILNDIEISISHITSSLRLNMIQTMQQNINCYTNEYPNIHNLSTQTMYSISNAMSNMRMPETPDQFPKLPDVLFDEILSYLTPIKITSVRGIDRRFCYASRQINLRLSHQYYSGLNLWVLNNNRWVVGRILPCGNGVIQEMIYDTHQVNEIHIQIEIGTIAVKLVDVLAKLSLLEFPPILPTLPINRNSNDPHDVCECGVYTGTCNNVNVISPKSSCWVLRPSIKPPTKSEIGTVSKFPKYTHMRSHVRISQKLERIYGISYNKFRPFSKNISKVCIKKAKKNQHIFQSAKPVNPTILTNQDVNNLDIFEMLD
jgi:hypothetical protein